MFKRFLSFLPFVVIFFGHYVSANLYAAVCAPLSFEGFLLSFVGTGSPVCNSLLSIVNYTSNTYNLILSGFIVYMAGMISTWTRTPNLMND
jgi:hypothetical protein